MTTRRFVFIQMGSSANLAIAAHMKFVLFILIALVAFSCTEKEKSETEAIRELLVNLIKADNRKDLDYVLSCYTSDAVLVPPGRPLIEGQDAIRANYQAIFASGALDLAIDVDSVLASGESGAAYGYTRGIVTALDNSQKKVRDRYVALVTRVNGQWRIMRLMWSPEQVVPSQPASN